MSFFDEIPPSHPEEGAPRQPEWAAPPENVVGATVPFDLVLASTGTVAVVVGGMTAYPTGLAFEVRILRREPAPDDLFFRLHHPRPGGFRFGVELPDGSRAFADQGPAEPGRGPTLSQRGGHGGGLSFELGMWLWPLPPAGPLRFACAWPDEGIEETSAELDAPIREAAARAIELWPDERPIGGAEDW
jgi:hypothetical protein